MPWGAMARPRDRDVHAVAIPRMGGVALFAGFALALFVAGRLPTLRGAFIDRAGRCPWIVVRRRRSSALIGVLDDRYELDSVTKLAGQVLATGDHGHARRRPAGRFLPAVGRHGTFSLGQDLAIPVTILLTVLTINAINFIDGLDGLAAGVTAIGARRVLRVLLPPGAERASSTVAAPADC